MRKFCCLLITLVGILHEAAAILGPGGGRDLLLTPKQAQELSGKRLYYEEQPTAGAKDRSWEHTLKHVTYVTLFTDAAVGAAAGNLSQLHDYHDFLQTPYVPADAKEQSSQSRFGDIVTLASGRLEQLVSNGSYRFVGGSSDPSRSEKGAETRALWRVQRIRHRDADSHKIPHRYHYEMKFSVSPLAADIGWPPQSFIQKESDYPQSFGRVTYEDKRENIFADRRQDRQPQETFVRGIFQTPPPPPPLNIGEYLQGVSESPKGTSKVELFPALYNLGIRPNFIPATTFRPSYPINFGPHPKLPTPLERYQLPNDQSGGTSGDISSSTGVTHHFHHHFYVSPGGLHEANSHPKLGYGSTAYTPEVTTPAPSTPSPNHRQGVQHDLEHNREVHFSTANSASGSAESLETGEDQHPHVQSPQLYTAYNPAPNYQKLTPLLIYAGSSAEAGEDQKTFVQSEPLEETIYRYSEPDPLYEHQNSVDVLHLDSDNYASNEPDQQRQHDEVNETTNEEVSQEPDEPREQQREQRPAGSQKQTKVASTTAPAVESTSSASMKEATESTNVVANPTAAAPTKSTFVSSSTSITPLRALSRYRTTPRITAGRSTTTTTTSTETPLLSKWKQRRKENATGQDSKAKSSHRHEAKIAYMPSQKTTSTTTTTTISNEQPVTTAAVPVAGPLPVPGRGVTEVLTQKSVSKSVSIKVGENGEEIPIIVDDDENEVEHS